MNSRYRIVLASLTAVAIGAGLFFWISNRVSGRGASTVPYTLLSQVKDYCDDGTVTDGFKELKFVDSKGNWRAVGFNEWANLSDARYEQGKGIEKVDRGGRRTLVDSRATGHSADVERLKRSDQYLRTVLVLGHPTYLLKVKDRNGDNMYLYHATDLNGDVIMSSYRMGKCRRVSEPLAIWRGDPNPASITGTSR